MHFNTGRKQSKEHIAKRVEAWYNSTALEKARIRFSKLNISHIGIPMPCKQKKAISKALMGKKNSLGCKRSLEYRKNLSEYWKDNPNHNFWIDGNGKERHSERNEIMSRLEYRLWRTSVFERDNYTCTICQKVGGKLHADHIKPYSTFPEFRFDIDNGQTLCLSCHRKTKTWGRRTKPILMEEIAT